MIDLRSEGRILYMSSYDITEPKGPSVNEREFLLALSKVVGKRLHALIPPFQNPLPDRYDGEFTFCWTYERYSPINLLRHRLAQIRAATALFEQYAFNFVIFRLGAIPLSHFYIAKRYNVPYVIKTLEIQALDTFRRRGGLRRAPFTLLHEVLIRNLTKHALAIDASTEKHVTHYLDQLPVHKEQVRWIDNATNTERFQPLDKITARRRTGLERFDPIIGYTGGSAWERGGAQMIEIAPKLLARYPKLGVVIVGGGDGIERLKRRASELGVSENCVFTGLVPYEQVANYINSFDIGFAFDTSKRLKTIGNSSQKIRQYVACGIPVMAGHGGNLFLEQEGLGSIVDETDLSEMVEAVIAWLSLSAEKQQEHTQKAMYYAQKKLSFDNALNMRLDFWQKRLQI